MLDNLDFFVCVYIYIYEFLNKNLILSPFTAHTQDRCIHTHFKTCTIFFLNVTRKSQFKDTFCSSFKDCWLL